MFLTLLLLLTIPPSLSGKSGSRNKTRSECDFQLPSFTSVNLKNILTWKPPENVKGLRYTVQYIEYGNDKWQKKLECTNITLTWCDLTNETNRIGDYQGKVTIYTKTCTKSKKTEKFHPLLNTEIGPPTVNVFSGHASIEIKLTHPIKLLHEKFKGLKYYIYINDIEKEIEEPYYRIEKIDPNTTYCITAKVYWFQKTSNLSEKKCITTNADHTSEQTIYGIIYIFPVTLIFCTITILGYAIHKYIHGSNRRQPQILNITTSNNNNVILVDAYTVTLNLITFECGRPNFQETRMSGKENKEFQNQNDLHITDDEGHISCGTEVIEETSKESKDDDGYVCLQEQVTKAVVKTAKSTLSPYDMPHHPREPIIPLSTTTNIVCEEIDLYGSIKSNASHSPAQEKDDLPDGYTTEKTIVNYPYFPQDDSDFPNAQEKDDLPVGYTTEKTIVNYPYFPQDDSDFPNVSKIIEDPHELENSFVDQELDILNVSEDTGLNESSTLFIDWSPDNPSFYIPNLSKKKELENCIKQCQEERGALLSQLYLPPEVKETSKDDELEQLEERWGLLIQDSEK